MIQIDAFVVISRYECLTKKKAKAKQSSHLKANHSAMNFSVLTEEKIEVTHFSVIMSAIS